MCKLRVFEFTGPTTMGYNSVKSQLSREIEYVASPTISYHLYCWSLHFLIMFFFLIRSCIQHIYTSQECFWKAVSPPRLGCSQNFVSRGWWAACRSERITICYWLRTYSDACDAQVYWNCDRWPSPAPSQRNWVNSYISPTSTYIIMIDCRAPCRLKLVGSQT